MASSCAPLQLGVNACVPFSAPSVPVQMSCPRIQSWVPLTPTCCHSDMSLWPWTNCCPFLTDSSWPRRQLDSCCGTKTTKKRKNDCGGEVQKGTGICWWQRGEGAMETGREERGLCGTAGQEQEGGREEEGGFTKPCLQLRPQHPQQWLCPSHMNTPLQGQLSWY